MDMAIEGREKKNDQKNDPTSWEITVNSTSTHPFTHSHKHQGSMQRNKKDEKEYRRAGNTFFTFIPLTRSQFCATTSSSSSVYSTFFSHFTSCCCMIFSDASDTIHT